jgi:UDP-3-O-[3-hydroxymyristoyl] glucosamine N-acyltransferase
VKLSDLAAHLGCRLEGDGNVDITRVTGIQDAGPGDLTFIANSKYEKLLSSTRASAVILREDGLAAPTAVLRARDPYLAFARAVGLFAPEWRPAAGVHALTSIASTARIGEGVSVGPFVTIGEGAAIGARTVIFPNVTIGPGATIGDDCVVHSNASIRERVTLGNRVVLQNGAVVGSDGFGFARRGDGTHEKIPQVATVVIEDDVELGANATVDRPAVGETRIRQGTKIDNLVHIAHGVSVGTNVLMAAQVGVAGSSVVQDDAVLGGQAGITGHITIERGAVVAAHAGVTNTVEAGLMVAGYPAIDSREWRRSSAVFRRLPEIKRRIEALEAAVRALTVQPGAETVEDPE